MQLLVINRQCLMDTPDRNESKGEKPGSRLPFLKESTPWRQKDKPCSIFQTHRTADGYQSGEPEDNRISDSRSERITIFPISLSIGITYDILKKKAAVKPRLPFRLFLYKIYNPRLLSKAFTSGW